jgi:hypothetical protein
MRDLQRSTGIIDTFYTVDLDRLFFDTEKLARLFGREAMKRFGIAEAEVERAQREIEAVNNTFDIFTYIRERAGSDEGSWREFEEAFVTLAKKEEVRMPGANELVTAFREHNAAYGFLTFAINTEYQLLKMRAAGIDLSSDLYWIITKEDKASRLSTMYVEEEGGYYQLPGEFDNIRTRSIVQIDDKARNFQVTEVRPSIRGYWVLDLLRGLPSQKGDIPSTVRHVDTLYDVVKLEFGS